VIFYVLQHFKIALKLVVSCRRLD